MTDYPRDPDRSDLRDSTTEPPVSGEAETAETDELVPSAVSEEALDRIASATVYDAEGEKIGSVSRVYLRDETGKPSWITVKSGFFGLRESLVPMGGVDIGGDELRVPFSKDVIKGAPQVDADDHLSPAEEEELHSYYRGHGWNAGAVGAEGERHDRELRDRELHDREGVGHEASDAEVREEAAREEFRAAPPEEHAARPTDRPADLSRPRDDADVVHGQDRDVRDDDADVRDDDRALRDGDRALGDDGRDPGRMSGSEALAAGSAGVAGAGVGGADWTDETAATDTERSTESERHPGGTEPESVTDKGTYDHDRLGSPASSHDTDGEAVSEPVDEPVREPMSERERVIANDPVSALDDPASAQKRDERFEKMDARTEELRDTSVTDALLDGNAGVGGIGSEGTDHGQGVSGASGASGSASPASSVGSVGTDDSGSRLEGSAASRAEGQDEFRQHSGEESTLDEVRDGGYGIGSAAPLGDGRRPLGHPIRAWEDTKSFRSGPAVGVEREADVWFFDENAAYNAGFHPAD